MSVDAETRFWNPVGILFAVVFLTVGVTFALVAAVAAGWIHPPEGAPGDIGFGPLGAGIVSAGFLYLASRCNLWVRVTRNAIVVRGLIRRVRLQRGRGLTATHEFRTRPTGLRLTAGDRSVLVYPRPRGSEALIRSLGGR